ncbi:hypothetical protein VJ918_07100 [Adlercreutzia sp. R21]|uniref:hypothetical protein n=1 Tax=Adlercreutzia wanghongyangiae TaxID=3111451 RepID=UPI002DBDD697|nr:hypothetical protein [Adlercreutzia sp. R21]MEC4184575.1 hypothetical protein [Adlercreutzia sp. R21]
MSKLDFSVYREQMRSIRTPDDLEKRIMERLKEERLFQEMDCPQATMPSDTKPHVRARTTPSTRRKRIIISSAAACCIVLAGIATAASLSAQPATPVHEDISAGAIDTTGMSGTDSAAGAISESEAPDAGTTAESSSEAEGIAISAELFFQPHLTDEGGHKRWSVGTIMIELPASTRQWPQLAVEGAPNLKVEEPRGPKDAADATQIVSYEVVATDIVESYVTDKDHPGEPQQAFLEMLASAMFEIRTTNEFARLTCDPAALSETAAALEASDSTADSNRTIPLVPSS